MMTAVPLKLEYWHKLFLQFLQNQWPFIVFCLGISFLAFGFELSNVAISIDEEISSLLNTPHPGWLGADRWGMYVINQVLQPGPSLPYYPLVLAISLNIATILLSLELWKRSAGIAKYPAAIFFLTMPSIAFVYQFHLASYGYYFGQFAAVLGVYVFVRANRSWTKLCSIAFFTWAAATYQATFFAAPVVYFLFLTFSLYDNKSAQVIKPKIILREALYFLICLGIALFLHQIISGIIRAELGISERYHSVDHFFRGSFVDLYNPLFVFREILAFLIGHKFYIGWPTGLAIIGSLIISGRHLYKISSGKQGTKLILPALIFAVGSPFLLIIITGHIWPARAMMSLPLVYGGLVLFTFSHGNLISKYFILACSGICFIFNIYLNTRLFYSDHISWENDQILAQRITMQAEILYGDSLRMKERPLVVVGKLKRKLNPAHIQFETFGQSLFEWDNISHHRIIPIFQLNGIHYFTQPSPDQVDEGKQIAAKMDIWPASQALSLVNGVFILKLGNP